MVCLRLRLIFLLFISSLSGCAGGGGAVHYVPECVNNGDPIEITIEFSVWGSDFWKNNLDDRYKEIKCYYWDVSLESRQVIDAKILYADKKKMKVFFLISGEMTKEAEFINYYFDYYFDGYYNRHDIKRIRIMRDCSCNEQ